MGSTDSSEAAVETGKKLLGMQNHRRDQVMVSGGEPLETLCPSTAAGWQGCEASERSPAAEARGHGGCGQGVE